MTKYSKFLFCDITSKLIQKRDISQHCPLLMEVIPFPLFCQKSGQYLFFVSLKLLWCQYKKVQKSYFVASPAKEFKKRTISPFIFVNRGDVISIFRGWTNHSWFQTFKARKQSFFQKCSATWVDPKVRVKFDNILNEEEIGMLARIFSLCSLRQSNFPQFQESFVKPFVRKWKDIFVWFFGFPENLDFKIFKI